MMTSSVVVPDLFLRDQSVNISCSGRMECDALYELGPPPDIILTMPPPPVPPFMEELLSRLSAEGINLHEDNKEPCNLCHWAMGNGVGFVELAQKGKTKKICFSSEKNRSLVQNIKKY